MAPVLPRRRPVQPPTIDMVERSSGLLVPATAADQVPDDGIARDADGRRRVVLTRDDQRLIDRTIRLLNRHGFGIVVGCMGAEVKGPGGTMKACGNLALTEGEAQDKGYGCKCGRIHFAR